jgi:5,10-methenyltetrahydrofolate synthetase
LALNRLEESKIFRQANCIALYHSLPDEVRASAFIEKWNKTKTILLPVINGDNIVLRKYTGVNNLTKGVYGIPEPEQTGEDSIIPEIIIIPGIAFDRHYNRIGRGKGYYDRLLSGLRVPKIGLCFSFQLLQEIPSEPFDIKMDMIVTDKELLQAFH